MKKFSFILLIFSAVFLIFSCASGTYLLTGKARSAISAEEVKVYSQAPSDYEIIGIVNAASDAGWTEQGSLNYAVAELKRQAAKIGANGVLIENVAKSTEGYVNVYGGFFVPVTAQNVSGKAIYVFSETEMSGEFKTMVSEED